MRWHTIRTFFRIAAVCFYLITVFACDRKRPPELVHGEMDLTQWSFQSDGAVDLQGEWRFFWMQYQIGAGLTNGSDRIAQTPLPWNFGQSGLPPFGYATYTAKIQMEKQPGMLGILIRGIGGAYWVWIDKRLAASSGSLGTNSRTATDDGSVQTVWFTPATNEFRITIWVTNFSLCAPGICDTIRLGDAEQIRIESFIRMAFQIAVAAFLITVALYHIALYFPRRKDKTPLYFGLFCLMVTVAVFAGGEQPIRQMIPQFDWKTMRCIESASLYSSLALLTLYIDSLFPKQFARWAMLSTVIVSVLFGAMVWIAPPYRFTGTDTAFQVFSLAVAIYIAIAIGKAVKAKEDGAVAAFIGFLFLLLSVAIEYLRRNYIYNGLEGFAAFGLIMFFILQTVLLIRRVTRAMDRALNQTSALETRVADRSAELEKQKAELEESRKAMTKAIDLITNFSKKIKVSMKARDIARAFTAEANRLIPFTSASVMFFNEETQLLDIIAAYGLEGVETVKFKPGEGIAGQVFVSGKEEYIQDIRKDTRFVHIENIPDPKSLICYPLKSGDRIYGVLNMDSDRMIVFSDEEKKLFDILIAFAGIAMDNAALYEGLEKKIKDRTLKMVETNIELEIERNELKKKSAIIEDELKLAKKIQMQFIPSESPLKSIGFYYQPMELLGGDYFDFIKFTSGKLGIFISDVSGHGVPAAFLTSMMKSFVLQYAEIIDNPSEFMFYLNDFIYNQAVGNFITVIYAIYDPMTNHLVYTNAGHNPPYFLSDDRVELFHPEKKTIPIGVMNNAEMEAAGHRFQNIEIDLESGTKLLFYTDGLMESVNIFDRLSLDEVALGDFETKLFAKIATAHFGMPAREFVKRMIEELVRFRGAEYFDDDVCMICIDIE